MNDGQEKTRDPWEVALERELEQLKACQTTRHLRSCLECSEIVGCEVRNRYVRAVYESMNKGTGGGFEF
jgi:hypothetical protein